MEAKVTVEAESEDNDAIAMLMADHLRVKKLFVRFEALKDDGSDEEKTAIVRQICQELTVHTRLEEEIFYPAVRKGIEDDDLMDEALVEHAGAKDLIAQLEAAHPEDDLYDAKVTVLGEQIDHHVTEEEGALFPKALYAEVDTLALGAQMLSLKARLLADGPHGVGPDEGAPEPVSSRSPPKKVPEVKKTTAAKNAAPVGKKRGRGVAKAKKRAAPASARKR